MTTEPDTPLLQVLPAGHGRAVELRAGDDIEIINQAGTQVVDTWAVDRACSSHLSVEHTRAINGHLIPAVGDRLYSSERKPLLRVAADSSPGVHDMLIPPCDAERYRQLGFQGQHRNCADNFREALGSAGGTYHLVPNPLNLFMNVPWTPEGDIGFSAPVSRPGDSVRLHAEEDLIIVLSACPQDLLPVNGDLLEPQDVYYRVLRTDD